METPNPNLEYFIQSRLGKTSYTIWLFESAYNYMWLYKHMMRELNDEYKKRYNHTDDHVTIQKLGELLASPPKNAKDK